MKNLILITCLTTFIGCAQSKEERVPSGSRFTFSENPVFLVAGQSNSVSAADQHPDHYSMTGLVTVNDYYNNPTHFFVPTQSNPSHGGVAWIYAGDMLGRRMTFNIVGVGGTNTQMWRESLYLRIQQALSTRVHDAVLWVQGESDSLSYFPEEDTYQNMKFVIQKSREVQPGIIWFVALDSMTGEPEDNRVRRAQKRIIAEGLAFQGPDIDYLHNDIKYSGGTVGGGDFIGEGLKEHGRLWYEILKEGF